MATDLTVGGAVWTGYAAENIKNNGDQSISINLYTYSLFNKH